MAKISCFSTMSNVKLNSQPAGNLKLKFEKEFAEMVMIQIKAGFPY